MNAWTSDELKKIGTAEELQIASLRKDGSMRNPVTIWVVRLDDGLYVRSMYGHKGAWYRGTQTQLKGHIRAGGVSKDVTFEAGDSALNDQIDAAYRAKYRRYSDSVVNSILTPEARDATIKLVPR